jgi:hypothetical protein
MNRIISKTIYSSQTAVAIKEHQVVFYETKSHRLAIYKK